MHSTGGRGSYKEGIAELEQYIGQTLDDAFPTLRRP
jgi:hypothetical protein